MMRRTCAALSPKLNLNQHPKNVLRFRPNSAGFWRPKYGASKMKWNFPLPYRRVVDSLLHYPEVSHVTGKPINWYHGEPDDGYEGARIFGEHTLELSGMPLGRTPEYMQERLRRFFSKFGPVVHCRAEPHPLDPYQCEGKAFVSFRDKKTALKALKAPLKFPASMHDKVISMRHLDSDKCNDPNYREKSRFWNRELVTLARQLHKQLSEDSEFRMAGKPLTRIGLGLLERELVELPASDVVPRGRGGVPLPRGLPPNPPTRLVSAGPAVRRRFGTWEAFLAEPPLDLLFSLERRPAEVGAGADSAGGPEEAASQAEALVVLPRLVSVMQRSRILFKLRMALERRLHGEFSIWWRQGKIPLPEYTQRRVDWWDHKPHLPFEVQIQSRSRHRHRIFDERFLYRMQLLRSRNAQRKERRAEWTETRKRLLAEREEAVKDRRERAMAAVEGAKCGGLLGNFPRSVPGGGKPPPVARTRSPALGA